MRDSVYSEVKGIKKIYRIVEDVSILMDYDKDANAPSSDHDQDYNRRKDMQRETISSEVCKRRCYFGKKLMRCHRNSRDSHSTATQRETERKR